MSHKHHIVFITGAGMSQESGLGTFRGNNGLWNNHKIEDVASPEGFKENPELVLDFYNERRQELLNAQPNSAHRAIVDLEDRYKVSVITQNVDDLHERSGSKNVIHLHGELLKARSTVDETLVYTWDTDLNLGDHCNKKGQLRPHVVWFGEEIHYIKEATDIVMTADLLVVVGTALQVYPAASLLLAAPLDCETVYIDPEPVIDDGINLTVIKEKATVGLEILVNTYLPY